MAIRNRYKNTLDDLINSSNLKSTLRLIDETSSRGGSTGLLEKDRLNEDVLASNRSSQLVPKTEDS